MELARSRGGASQTAGWGFTVVTGGNGNDDAAADETHSRCGHVVTDAQQPGYIGAERLTNNTGELTAIAQALEYILADRSGRPVLVRYSKVLSLRNQPLETQRWILAWKLGN